MSQMYPQPREEFAAETKAWGGIVVTGNDDYFERRTAFFYRGKKGTEKLNRLRRRNRAIVYVSGDDQRGVRVVLQKAGKPLQHNLLIFQKALVVKDLAQMKIGGMEKFNH